MFLLVSFIIAIHLKGFEQLPSSFPENYRSNQGGYFDDQMGPVQGTVQPHSYYDQMQQPALRKTPFQAHNQIKLPQNINGYELVHPGHLNQGQPNSPQMPPNTQENPKFMPHNPAHFKNNYPTPSTYYEQAPAIPSSPSPCQSNDGLNNYQGQHQFQVPSQNNYYQLPQPNYPSEHSSNPYENIINRFGVKSSRDFNSDRDVNNVLKDALQMTPQYLPQGSLQNRAPSASEYAPYNPDRLSYPLQSPNQFPIYGNGGGNNGAVPNREQYDDFQVGGDSSFRSPQEKFPSDPFLHFPTQQQGSQPIKREYPNVNTIMESHNHPQPKQHNVEINDEGYQVVNEGPVHHYVSIGEPNTKVQGPATSIQPSQNSESQPSEIQDIQSQMNFNMTVNPNTGNV